MKAPAAVSLALVLLLAGCNDQRDAPVEPSNPVFESSYGPVTLVSLSRDEGERTIDAGILVSDSRRHVILRPLEDAPYQVGVCAAITDADQRLLFRMQLAWDLSEPNVMWLQEQTASDELVLTIRHAEDRTSENYEINGESFSVEYPTMDGELRESVLTSCMQEEPLVASSSEIAELAAQFASFQEYYSRHADNTLHNNDDGELLAFLISDRQFVNYIVGEDQPSVHGLSGVARPSDAELICAIAGLCGFKCFIPFSYANPFCWACSGVGLACVIATIACWIFDCGP